jgi:hypothetical protein
MELKKIESLLEKYNEGETTLQEEIQLRDYFTQQESVPEEWVVYCQLFQYYAQAQKETLTSQNKEKSFSTKTLLLVAAGAALVFSLQLSGVFEASLAPINEEAAKLAFQEFQNQMKTVSTHLNKGAEKVAYFDYWNTTTQKLIK